MPFANEHAARQAEPGTFERDSFRRKVLTNGVTAIIGRHKGSEATDIQSIRFDAAKFTPTRARAWLKSHGYKTNLEVATGEDAKLDSEDTEEVQRFDRGEFDETKFRVDSQGFMHLRGTFSTVGVYKYRMPDGSVRREYRPAAEVQSKRFIDSLKGCVIVNEHLPNRAPVTIRNVRKYQVGHAGTDVEPIGLKVDGSLTLTDANTIVSVHQGKQRGLSVGYRCKTRREPGIWQGPSGPEPYDFVQYGHLANHIAITSVPRGGLGKDGTSLHLDSFEAEQITEDNKMETIDITVDGATVTVLAAHATFLKGALDKRDSELEESKGKLTELGAKIGELETEQEKLTKERDQLKTDSEDKPNVAALVKARIEFNENVKGLIEEEALSKIDSESEDYEAQVIDTILTKHGVDLEEAKKLYTDSAVLAAYKRARFDGLVEGKGDEAHRNLSSAVVNSSVTRTDSNKDYRKDLNRRLKIAQQKRDGTYVEDEKKTA